MAGTCWDVRHIYNWASLRNWKLQSNLEIQYNLTASRFKRTGRKQWDNWCLLNYYLWRARPFSAPVESLVSNKYIWLRFVPTKNVVGVSLSQQHAQASEPHWKRWISAQELIFVILAVLSCDTERSWSCMSGLNAKSRIGSRWSDTYFSVNQKIYLLYL